MAREADPRQKIARLQAAKAAFKQRETCNLEELAAAIGDTPRAVSAIVKGDPGFPVIQHGSSGVDYKFRAHAALNHMIAGWQAKIASREAKAQRMARLAGLEVDAGTAAEFSLADLRVIQGMQRETQRSKLEQGHYTLTADVSRLLSTIFGTVQSDYLGIRAALDSAGHWPPEIVDGIEEHMRTRLVSLHRRIKGDLMRYEAAGEIGG